MKYPARIAASALLLLLCAGVLWALADSKNVTILFEAEWEANTDLPGGGIIVGRGEGSNGVISVNLPMPPPTETGGSRAADLGRSDIHGYHRHR